MTLRLVFHFPKSRWPLPCYIIFVGELVRKIKKTLSGGVIRLKPATKPKGVVLLSYTTLPFISPQTIDGHSNRWECRCVAELFLARGYEVDIVDYDNTSFRPKRRYAYCIDIHNNFKTFATHLDKDCVKVFHITSSHWLFQNTAEYRRLLAIQARRAVTLSPKRTVSPSYNIEYCDIATMLGNATTAATYAYADKKIYPIPVSTTHTYPSPAQKDFTKASRRFIWLGGSGMAHKGLDLVLEAFMEMPDMHLTIFGKQDVDFTQVYRKELFNTPHIRYLGYIDMGSKAFINNANSSLALIFPSCSEGSAGGVVTAMHAGLIPVISRESGVDVHDFGIILAENSTDEIKKQIRMLAASSPTELRNRAVSAWEYARTYHTREMFRKKYDEFIDELAVGTVSVSSV